MPVPAEYTFAVIREYCGTEIVPVRVPGVPLVAETFEVLVLVIWGRVL